MEPGPGERFEVDWGHFDTLSYQGHARKLYAFCLVECRSRKLYLEFTHSQSFETFVRCHIHAFRFMVGIARELWFDNLATAVPNMTATWYVSIRVFWPSLANKASVLGLAMCVRRGKKEK
jgi:transposase